MPGALAVPPVPELSPPPVSGPPADPSSFYLRARPPACPDSVRSRHDVIILYEVYERAVSNDILLAVFNRALTRRKVLRVVIMCAIMDVAFFKPILVDSPVLHILETLHAVVTRYAEQPVGEAYVDAADNLVVTNFLGITSGGPSPASGHVLIVLAGEEQILRDRATYTAAPIRPSHRTIVPSDRVAANSGARYSH